MYIVHDRDCIALTMYNPTNAVICLKHKVKLIFFSNKFILIYLENLNLFKMR